MGLPKRDERGFRDHGGAMTQQTLSFEKNAGAIALASEISSEFRRVRLDRKLTQRQVGDRIGCSDSAIASLESKRKLCGDARSFPTIDLVRRACDFYGMPAPHMIERMRHLRKLTGARGEMRVTGGLGRNQPPRENGHDVDHRADALLYSFHPRYVESFPELVRPGVRPSLFLAVFAGLCAMGVLGLCVWQVVRVWRAL